MSKYFGVIGNKDYIKYQGERRPYWEFLDFQPDGWLTSLAYKREDLPENEQIIFDCGAWSYKDMREPKIGKELVTPDWVFGLYQKKASPGDFLIAPDHMLIDRFDHLEERREFNRKSAIEFLQLTASTEFIPMAAIHGVDFEERIKYATWLNSLGYKALALGGMAGKANAKVDHIKAVKSIRAALPDAWLHVLGLSSPWYANQWHRLGIDSFDGSSHFKQAFTAGVFFVEQDGKLIKYKAAKTERGNPDKLLGPITAPECECRACVKLRLENIDTRQYGSNEHNMGRAAHNQNMLMRAHRRAMRQSFILVSCVGEKREQATPAQDLYQSTWFKKARTYAQQNADDWYILSALHGLVGHSDIIEPYEKTLNTMTSEERHRWAKITSQKINACIPPGSHLVVLAGRKYRDPLTTFLVESGYTVDIPMEGLGIGQQLAWLDVQNQVKVKQLSFLL